jgi:GNAT superfamily N-acetyltransferase
VCINHDIFLGMYLDEPYSFEQYVSKLDGKNPMIFIALKDGRIIGNSISLKREDSFYIWILGVIKKEQNNGVGNKLLEANENYAKENNFDSVSVKVYNISVNMKKLLESRGYTIIKVDNAQDEKYCANHYVLKIR